MIQTGIAQIDELKDALIKIRHDIHAHPELAFNEHRTAQLVANELNKLGMEVHTGVGKTGVVGVLRVGEGTRTLALRADMDALPIQEDNTFAHRSQHAGCMHACGHDGHTTMLLGAAQYLSQTRNFNGTVVFVFQPAEEGLGGAAQMIREGFFERFPVDAIYGMHNWPGMPEGMFGIHPGPVMASADRFDIEITGHGAHAAMPHLGLDPVVAGAALVQAAQSIVARTTDPLESAVVSITQFHAGEAYNAIPQRAALCGTIRALRAHVRHQTKAALERMVQGIGQTHNVKATLKFVEGEPPTVNSRAEAELCREVATGLVGEANVRWNAPPSMGAEDFSHFLEKSPGCYVWLGVGGEAGDAQGCSLHNARYDFNDRVLTLGVAYWVRLAQTYLV